MIYALNTSYPKNKLYSKGDIITGLKFDNCIFDIKINVVIRHQYYYKFSEYLYSIHCHNKDWHELKDILYPLSHLKLNLLIKGKLPEDYNNSYNSL